MKEAIKNNLAIFTLVTAISFSSVLRAEEEVKLPVIARPAILQEGTQRELSPAQIAEMLPWAKDSKMFLVDLLDNIQTLSPSDKVDHLIEGIQSVVGDSAPKNSELLMRYILNRGLVLNDILTRETDANSVGVIDAKLRVLQSSVKGAINYYDKDIEFISKKTKTSFAEFGLNYYTFLSELNKSIFDASAQYFIQRTAFEWLQWDLYRDINNATYAPYIVKINNSLKTFSDKRKTDAQSIASLRQMKATANQLNVSELLLNIKLSQAKTEKEKQAILDKIASDEADKKNRLEEEKRGIKGSSEDASMAIAVGNRVSNGINTGVVLEVFPSSGDFNVTLDGYDSYKQVWKAAGIGKALTCYKGLCVGNPVYNMKNAGVIKAIFTNGNVHVALDGYDSYIQTWTITETSKATKCVRAVCIGSRVNKDSLTGTVLQVYENNQMYVKLDGYDDYKQFWTVP